MKTIARIAEIAKHSKLKQTYDDRQIFIFGDFWHFWHCWQF